MPVSHNRKVYYGLQIYTNKKEYVIRGKEEVKLFINNMILEVECSKECTEKLLEMINDFCTFVGYKINVKHTVFPGFCNEQKKFRKHSVYYNISFKKKETLWNKFNQGSIGIVHLKL